MKKGTSSIFTFLVGVAILRVATYAQELDQSSAGMLNSQPIELQETSEGRRKLETPEVVLQLKYDGGELNRIYLAQFRKEPKEWAPSVSARSNLCSDLCYAGLGGDSCGARCQELLPVGLNSTLQQKGVNSSELVGEPRVAVCPTLCENNLGYPLCNCEPEVKKVDRQVNWMAICNIFCLSDRYVLGGCPVCEASPTSSVSLHNASTRVLTTTKGWFAWCDVQCRQGQGGAACNCDRSPFQ